MENHFVSLLLSAESVVFKTVLVVVRRRLQPRAQIATLRKFAYIVKFGRNVGRVRTTSHLRIVRSYCRRFDGFIGRVLEEDNRLSVKALIVFNLDMRKPKRENQLEEKSFRNVN